MAAPLYALVSALALSAEAGGGGASGGGGLGYGLGVGMVTNAGRLAYAGTDGDFSWGGYYETQWLASPLTGVVAVLMTQLDPSAEKEPRRMLPEFRNLLYASITDLDLKAPTKK